MQVLSTLAYKQVMQRIITLTERERVFLGNKLGDWRIADGPISDASGSLTLDIPRDLSGLDAFLAAFPRWRLIGQLRRGEQHLAQIARSH